MKHINLLLLLMLFPLLSFAQSTKEIGQAFIDKLFQKQYTEVAALFDESVKEHVTPQILEQTEIAITRQLGAYKGNIETNQETEGKFKIIYYYSQFENEKLDIKLVFNSQHKATGFFFVPHKEFEKQQNNDPNNLNIPNDHIIIKGTFLNPKENKQKKIVIFLHGSGPNDKDETIGPNKPFRDIAEHFYQNGISSYRFDKRTLSYPETFTNNSTVEEEVINDALHIIDYFSKNYKDYQLILLGHSLGGYLLPKIMEHKPNVSKLIFLSANARPLDKIIIEQLEYMNVIDSTNISTELIEQTKSQVALLNSNQFNLQTPNSKLPFGLSASYWKYLLDYKPLESLKKIGLPMFFVQGGKDYQVTEEDFNLWKKTLQKCNKCQFKFYPSLNHIFITGGSPPSPADYNKKESVHISPLEDITSFILNK